jgi:hypothetical protein
MRNSLSGIALVLASVLPAALNPSTGGVPPVATSPSVVSSRSATVHKGALAFKPGCELPFDNIKTEGLTIDAVCSEDGNAGTDTGKRLESNAKNNFCVDGDPIPISYDDFKNLQAASDNIGGLKTKLDTTRDPLFNILSAPGRPQIGEGSLVQFVGFVLDAHFSNVGKGKGELVNCKLPDEADNDIHIELMMDPADDDPCNGVTAEMSPHFRPETWDELVNLKIERPVRITGPLFFDSSHQPCRNGKRPNPKRISVWEIHPIYQFEVCKDKTLTACDVRNASQWIPLDQWHSVDDETEP